MKLLFAVVRPASLAALVATFAVSTSPAQQPTPPRPATPANGDRPTRRPAKFDQARAESLYVSTDPVDHPPRDFERDIVTKAKTDSIYAVRSRGVMEFSKVKYRSRAGDMDVPAYLFLPLTKRGPRGHAAMVWVHGGVHGVEPLHVPILVHVATNDLDVNYAEDQQLVWKLRALKPDLAETKIYVDPVTLERVDSPEQIDSWNRTWVFFEWWLRSRESGIGSRE